MPGDEVAGPRAGAWPTGRLGAWHGYRWHGLVVVGVLALAVPWPVVPDVARSDLLVTIALVSSVWAVPAWRCGVVVDQRGVRCTGLVWSHRYRWDQIATADVGWHDLEPRLLLALHDGDEVCVPGLRMPQHQAYRRDLWNDSRMFAAAMLISDEADRRRASTPVDGTVVPRRRATAPPVPVVAYT